jgi:hypothetical protein
MQHRAGAMAKGVSRVTSNLERFKAELKELVAVGEQLGLAMQADCHRDQIVKVLKREKIEDPEQVLKELPSFRLTYQSWYSEALAAVRQLLPDRLADFVSHYQRPKGRKEITPETYRIEDYLQGLTVTRGYEQKMVVGPAAACPQFEQQLAILKAAEGRFDSSLYDIRRIVQADLFDSDLESAEELAKKGYARASGAMAGVVLEKHLAQVCGNHHVTIAKKTPTISDLNDALKQGDVIDVPQWRFVQHLADIRNLCDHSKATEPTAEQVRDLLAGVRKVTKTLF